MATRNDVTGDELKSRSNTDAYKDGYDRIWGNKKQKPEEPQVAEQEQPCQQTTSTT